MPQFEPYKYYATIHERLRRLDGTKSHYDHIPNGSRVFVIDKQINTKAELVAAVEQALNRIVDVKDFTVSETEHGFLYERYIKWSDDQFTYTVEEPGQHSDHETYVIDITYYVEQPNPVQFLAKMDEIRARCEVSE